MIIFLLQLILKLNTFLADENEERSMVEPASLENPKVKELQEVHITVVLLHFVSMMFCLELDL